MSTKVIFLPLRVGLGVTRTTLGLSARLAARVAGEVVRVAESRFSTPAPARSSSAPAEAPAAAPSEPASTSNGAGAAPVIPLAADVVSPLEEYPDTPLTREAADAKTIDDTDEVVAEFAEPGAEDGAGAQIVFDEPWAGYDAANVEAVTDEIAGADAAELAVIELYEQTHKGRRTVLDAAARRLKELSPPDGG